MNTWRAKPSLVYKSFPYLNLAFWLYINQDTAMKTDQSKTMPMWMFYTLLISLLALAVGGGTYFFSKFSVKQAEIPVNPVETSGSENQAESSGVVVYDPGIPQPSATVSPTRNLSAIAPANATTEFIIGDTKTADVTIIEYLDLNCPHCKNYHATLKTVTKEFGDRIVWVIRHYPVLGSSKRAAWMECVGEKRGETAYWQYLDRYFEEVTGTSVAHDEAEFNNWLDEKGYSELDCDQEAMLAKVTSQWTEGNKAGVSATPTIIFVDKSGQKDLAMGAMSPEDLRQVINSYLP